MGQKVHPIGFRVGITKNYDSIWYSRSKDYVSNLKEDAFIRDFFYKNLKETCISNIEIKRKLDFLVINVSVVKPSVVIGNNGVKLYELKNKLVNLLYIKFCNRNVTINIVEVLNPDSNSRVLTDFICQQLEKRVPFRRVMKNAVMKAQKSGVKGIKVQVAGRLNGAEIARTEWIREGQVPLHTLKANIDYFNFKALVNILYTILYILYNI
jgi:small subunit ribosomal protein S3